jgi:hypothetical protein
MANFITSHSQSLQKSAIGRIEQTENLHVSDLAKDIGSVDFLVVQKYDLGSKVGQVMGKSLAQQLGVVDVPGAVGKLSQIIVYASTDAIVGRAVVDKVFLVNWERNMGKRQISPLRSHGQGASFLGNPVKKGLGEGILAMGFLWHGTDLSIALKWHFIETTE